MAAKTVNLDALIVRDDFASEAPNAGGNPRPAISLSELGTNSFFRHSLRKPDFQRETTHWTPAAVCDLIRAFLQGDLIPAVILWERGGDIFAIDGAHRLSALIAWIDDDYGDRSHSIAMFGDGLTDEQKQVADRTRKLINKDIGPYAEFAGLSGQTVSDPVKARYLTAIAVNSIIIQWVTASTTEAAENSFFKINQAAQPIDPVERRILQSRAAPNAIAARCIARGGKGHKYWADFDATRQKRIELLGEEIWAILYKPPHTHPITTSDLPIAGQGYNALPFVFDLVCAGNGITIPNSKANKTLDKPLPPDETGEETIEALENVKKRLMLVSTDAPGSLGFHPLVYYYARSGAFLSNAFLASLEFAKKLDQESRKNDFTRVRKRFEDYLHANKLFVTLTISRLGSGARSLNRVVDLYWFIFDGMHQDQSDVELFQAFIDKQDFRHLKLSDVPPATLDGTISKRGASRGSKSAAYIEAALQNPVRCNVCGGAIHSNAVTFDHVIRVEDGGDNRSENLRPSHPYCNSGFKG